MSSRQPESIVGGFGTHDRGGVPAGEKYPPRLVLCSCRIGREEGEGGAFLWKRVVLSSGRGWCSPPLECWAPLPPCIRALLCSPTRAAAQRTILCLQRSLAGSSWTTKSRPVGGSWLDFQSEGLLVSFCRSTRSFSQLLRAVRVRVRVRLRDACVRWTDG